MSFAQKLMRWQRRHGRHDLPWQGTRDPYRIWLAEVMLQQTQVAAVVPYYERFLRKYPTVEALAAASEEDVLRLWSGLGYYARGRNLCKAAQQIASAGAFPRTAAQIQELPGIGRSTAAAIAAFAFGERAAILDGNVKRVLARCFGTEKDLWRLAERLLPRRGIETYTQGLMDFGATLCTRRPRCDACPVARQCIARKTGRIAELPAPRQRKPLPLKKVSWFVYLNRGRVLLARRASPGIWGGLLCFPEVADRAFGAVRRTRLEPIEHGFTHFRLRIQPLLHEVKVTDGAGRWMRIREAQGAAVPTPVKNLLQNLQRNATVRVRAKRLPARGREARISR
jgi:A/G-specific adenine glycosylase